LAGVAKKDDRDSKTMELIKMFVRACVRGCVCTGFGHTGKHYLYYASSY